MAMRGAFIKNTDFTDAHGWVFSRILYPCSAAHCLVFDAPPAQQIATDFSHAEGALRSEKSMEICGICGQQISAQCAKEQAECIYSPTDRTRRFSQKPCGVPLSKKHGLHRCARMGLFTDSLLLLRCPLLGFDAQSAQRIGFFRMRRVVWENVTRWACLVCEKSVEICEICGRQISAQCAKEQAGCFYSPTDLSDKHRCHADCLSITQIAPSAPCDRLTLNIKIAGDGLP